MQEYGFFKENLGCIPEDIMRMSETYKDATDCRGHLASGLSWRLEGDIRLQMAMVLFKGVRGSFHPQLNPGKVK